MALLTNPMTADLQQRIQNSSFGSPDYLQGFQGTMPTWQRNMIMNNYMPGLLTPEGTNAPVDPAGIPDYRGYTPGVPPQFTQNPIVPLTAAASNVVQRQGGGGGENNPNSPNYKGPGVSTEFVGDNAFRINSDGTVSKLDPDSIDYKLANFMNTITGFSPMNMAKNALGLDPNADYEKTLAIMQRVQNKYGQDTAKDFMSKAFPDRPTTGNEFTGSGAVGSTGPTARTGGYASQGGTGGASFSGGKVSGSQGQGQSPHSSGPAKSFGPGTGKGQQGTHGGMGGYGGGGPGPGGGGGGGKPSGSKQGQSPGGPGKGRSSRW